MRARKIVTLLTATTMAWGAFVPFAPLATNVAQARAESSALQMVWQTPIGEGTTLLKYTKSFADKPITVMVTRTLAAVRWQKRCFAQKQQVWATKYARLG